MRRSSVEAVLSSVVATLRADATLTTLSSGGVYNDVPQGTPYPYLVVSSPTDRRVDTMGRLGAELTVDVRAVSAALGDREAARMTDRVIRLLDLQPLATTQHTTLGVAWDSAERFSEIINGVVVRHHVASFRVWTEQSTT